MVFWEGYVGDEAMGTIAPIVVYWIYAGFYHLLPPLEKFRLHTRKEEDMKNLVPFPTVVRGVLLQQLIQAFIAFLIFSFTSPPEAHRQPSLLVQLMQIMVAMLVADTWYYFVHRYMLHQNKHHKLVVPYAIGALYSHPIEGLLDTCGGTLSFLVSGMTARTPVFFFSFMVIKNVDEWFVVAWKYVTDDVPEQRSFS